jgi:hypothetical protein
MVDDALTMPGRATAPFQDRAVLHADGDVEGVLGWVHQQDTRPLSELPRWQQRPFVADLATVQILRALVDEEHRRAASERTLTDEELTQLQTTLAPADRFIVIPDPNDPDLGPLFEGHAAEAIGVLPDGIYAGRGIGGQELQIVVGPSRFAAGGRAAASLPLVMTGSGTLDPIARRPRDFSSTKPPFPLRERLAVTTGRDGMDSGDPAAARLTADRTSSVGVCVITWSDDPEVEPTIMVRRRIVELNRSVATMLYEELRDSNAFQGATEFLKSHTDDWEDARAVDDWLEALKNATPFPRVTLTQVRVEEGDDSYNHNVADALARRAADLDHDDPPAVGPSTPRLRRAL